MMNSKSKPQVRWHFDQDAACLALIEPWCVKGAKALHRWIRQHLVNKCVPTACGLDGVSIESFAEGLLKDLQSLLARTLEMEFQISRLLGEITPDKPTAEFEQFLRLLQCPDRQEAFWQEYVMLQQRLKQTIRSWVRSTAEMLSHLQKDFQEICVRFGIDPQDTLQTMDGVAGDRHRHGRRVQILCFASGRKLVYKPRNLDAENAFYDITQWLRRSGFSLPLKSPTTYAQANHGWVEFIKEKHCDDDASRRRFHHRQGAMLAILHLLDATDITCENLIPSGEYPVIIDSEAICSPFYVATSGSNHPETPHALSTSVMRVGMLPQKAWRTASGMEVDVSAMAGTDAANYRECIVAGFREAAQLIQEHRHEWTKPDGVLNRLHGIRARLIARPTRAYSMLLHESTHPDMMRTQTARIDMMRVLWGSHPPNEISERFVRSEVDALCREDIPIFEIEVDSGWVHSCCEERLVQLQPSPLECVQTRLEQWSCESIDRECLAIEMALQADSCDQERAARQNHRIASSVTRDPVDFLVTTSIEMAERLDSRRYHSDWLDLTLSAGRDRWCVSNISPDLYSGRCGVALSLATLARRTGLNRFAEIAEAVMQPVRTHSPANAEDRVGAFSGIAGEIYAAVHLSDLLQDVSWLDWAHQRLVDLTPSVPGDIQLDLIAGSAGCLAVLESVGDLLSSDLVDRCKAECALVLIGSAVSCDRGVYWPIQSFENQAMTGLAHGNAGIAMALSQMASVTQGTVHDHVMQAIEFEQSHFDTALGIWKDLRPENDTCMTAWCHGASGIGISRLQLLKKLDCPELQRQVKHAVSATLRNGFGSSHCLCHGDLGNLDFLLQVSRHDPEIISPEQTLELATQIAHSVRRDGPRCGTPGNIETPGLMTGIAGIAWGLARASAPTQIPSILALDPPVNAKANLSIPTATSFQEGE